MNFGTEFPRQALTQETVSVSGNSAQIEYLVYTHINKINGHCYVGITKHTEKPNKRWHCGKGYSHSPIFQKAILKYGWDSFEHTVERVGSKDEAYSRERELIKKYKNLGISYNVAEGGEGIDAMAEETKEKLRHYTPWIKGKHHTEEARRKISEAGMGRKMSERNKRILHEVNTTRQYPKVPQERKDYYSVLHGKPVLQIDKNTGFVIAEFSSARDAERLVSPSGKTCGHVSEVCLGNCKRKTCYGYKWRYKE